MKKDEKTQKEAKKLHLDDFSVTERNPPEYHTSTTLKVFSWGGGYTGYTSFPI